MDDGMEVGDLYYVGRKLKAYAERTLGAKPGDIEAVPLHHRLILKHVLGSPGATIQELSTRLSLAQSMVSTAVGALRNKGLVTSEVDPSDRRRVRVMPSEQLQKWARTRLHVGMRTVLEPLLAPLSIEDRECVLRALDLLNASFRNEEEIAPPKEAAMHEVSTL
ncbi:MAG: MarR family winged helix-turn-helix transcriptional regulator [Actinomycetota bacterium]|nr:MarR family winged helix-turn-helix transcriptional regulator [Actinomycetota bacterium]